MDQTTMHCFFDSRRPSRSFQFGQQAFDMRFNRALGDAKIVANGLVAFALGDDFRISTSRCVNSGRFIFSISFWLIRDGTLVSPRCTRRIDSKSIARGVSLSK
jgi:hypothetical protein